MVEIRVLFIIFLVLLSIRVIAVFFAYQWWMLYFALPRGTAGVCILRKYCSVNLDFGDPRLHCQGVLVKVCENGIVLSFWPASLVFGNPDIFVCWDRLRINRDAQDVIGYRLEIKALSSRAYIHIYDDDIMRHINDRMSA